MKHFGIVVTHHDLPHIVDASAPYYANESSEYTDIVALNRDLERFKRNYDRQIVYITVNEYVNGKTRPVAHFNMSH